MKSASTWWQIRSLRIVSYEEPTARATVIRGKLNDTLILDLDGINPGLAFDLFTVPRRSQHLCRLPHKMKFVPHKVKSLTL
jgi:hypothetical protein